MKNFWRFIAWCFPVAANFILAQAIPVKTSRPDVYLVTIDTLRADHVHCYGDDQIKTPAIDALAKAGIRFSQAFTPSPITNSSHTSILTGLLPSSHGVTDFAIPLANNHVTMSELLKKNGYRTAAFIGAVILDSKTLAPGLDRGFDFYDNFPEHSSPNLHWGRVERRGLVVVQRAESWMSKHTREPRFVWIHLYDPHDPYEPPAPYSRIYKDRLYDGEIAYADSALAEFVAYLKQHGRYENALIIVVGDHGEGLGEHHEQTHGIFLYDSTTHVPLIIKIPNQTSLHSIKPQVVDAQVRTTDILPTVLDVLKLTASPQSDASLPFFDGKSLQPYFTHTENTDRLVLAETDYPLRFGWAALRAVRAGGLKFIEAPKPELYDLRADPGELTNEYEPWNEKVQRFRQELSTIRTKGADTTPSAGAAGAETLEELRALGYLGPADAHSATNVPEPSMLPDPKDKIEEQNLLHTAMMAGEAGKLSEARSTLETVLQLDPASATALRQLGELELRASNYSKAADYLRRARDVRPADSAAAFYEAQALQKIGDLPAARDALDASLKLTPGQFDARVLLGKIYMQMQDAKESEDQFGAALLLKPDNVDAVLGLARAEIKQKKFEDAVRQLESHQKPETSELLELLAEAYSALGKNEQANQARHRALIIRNKVR